MDGPEMAERTLKPVDIGRKVLIWKWLLNPRDVALPEDVTKEELVEIFNDNVDYLNKFPELCERIARMQRPFTN